MKLVSKMLGGLIVLGAITAGVYYYFSNPRVISSLSQQVTSCVSPLGKSVYEKGSSAYKYASESGQRTDTDHCNYYVNGAYSRVGQLEQTYCDKGYLVSETVNCGWGSICRDGICMKGKEEWSLCSDTDNGIDTKVRGMATVGGSAFDECWVSPDKVNPENSGSSTDKCSGADCYQYEYYCNGDERAYKISPSPAGCENGATK